jgi:4-amino-4-deoxy-L-arabinose transferase-like glycosyltransferase
MISALTCLSKRSLAVPLAACAAINAALLLAIWGCNPEYMRDYRINGNQDARQYVLLGRNIFLYGAYSRNSEPPFVADIFRTPGYPVVAGGLDLIGGAALIYGVQAILHIGLCAVVWALAGTLFGERVACAAAFLVAIYPTLLALNVQAMSEMLFLFLLALSVLALTATLNPCQKQARRLDVIAGVLLGLAILVRPAGLYLPILIASFLAIAGVRAHGFARAASRTVIFLLGVAVCLAPWIARNYATFGVATLTTNDTVVMIHFTGAGAYQIHHNVDRETASAMIAREFNIHTPDDMWNYHLKGLSPVEMDLQARGALFSVLGRYPADLCKSCALGLVKAFLSHDAAMFADVLKLRPWTPPGTGGLLRFEDGAWHRLLGNHPFLIVVFALQLHLNGALIVLGLLGALLVARQRAVQITLLLLFAAFFLAVCAASGIDAFTRFSAPTLPFACVFAAVALVRLGFRDGPEGEPHRRQAVGPLIAQGVH